MPIKDDTSVPIQIDANTYYSCRETAAFLDVTPETVKTYCKGGKLRGKQIGPKKEWHVSGAAIKKLRKLWGL